MSGLIKYLSFCDEINLNTLPKELKILTEYYKEKGILDRILNFALEIRTNIKSKLKVIDFKTGTHRVAFNSNGNHTTQNGFVLDNSNLLYKHWFKLKHGKEDIYLPIQINEEYHHFDDINKSQYTMKINKHKVEIIGTKEAIYPTFKDQINVEGMDLNVKNNFGVLSDGTTFDYNRDYIKKFVALIKELELIGMKNISDLDQRRLDKVVKANEWYFKKLIKDILDYCELNNITDLVMEDLDSFHKTFIRSDEFDIKYSKLVRLLRLSNIKNWMTSQAEKRGIRVHLTSARYSSQQCSNCGCIDSNNRLNQEEFKCVDCGFEINADLNASINLRNRFLLDVLKDKLHDKDQFNRLKPKPRLNKDSIKLILESNFKVPTGSSLYCSVLDSEDCINF